MTVRLSVIFACFCFLMFSKAKCQTDLEQRTQNLEDSIRFALYKDKPYYEVVNYGANNILFHGDSSTAMHSFFDALYNLQTQKKGKVKVLHIGDSHIQADFFTGRVRHLFQTDKRFGDAGRGMTFPYKAARTNNPFDYTTTYTGVWTGQKIVSSRDSSQWGIAGITVSTSSPNSTIRVAPKEYNDQPPSAINKVRIYYPILNEELFEATVIAPKEVIVSEQMHPDGYLEVIFSKPQSAVEIGLQQTAPEQNHFLLQGISLETDKSGIVYHAVGVNGAESRHFLRCVDFDVQVKSIDPDLVVISLGTNDAYPSRFDDALFKQNMLQIISQIRKIKPNVSILLTTPNDTYRYKRYANHNTSKAERRLLELMREQNVGLWNFYQIMGGFKSISKWKETGLGQYDRIHLSQKGYILQGDLFFEAIDEAYQEWISQHHPK